MNDDINSSVSGESLNRKGSDASLTSTQILSIEQELQECQEQLKIQANEFQRKIDDYEIQEMQYKMKIAESEKKAQTIIQTAEIVCQNIKSCILNVKEKYFHYHHHADANTSNHVNSVDENKLVDVINTLIIKNREKEAEEEEALGDFSLKSMFEDNILLTWKQAKINLISVENLIYDFCETLIEVEVVEKQRNAINEIEKEADGDKNDEKDDENHHNDKINHLRPKSLLMKGREMKLKSENIKNIRRTSIDIVTLKKNIDDEEDEAEVDAEEDNIPLVTVVISENQNQTHAPNFSSTIINNSTPANHFLTNTMNVKRLKEQYEHKLNQISYEYTMKQLKYAEKNEKLMMDLINQRLHFARELKDCGAIIKIILNHSNDTIINNSNIHHQQSSFSNLEALELRIDKFLQSNLNNIDKIHLGIQNPNRCMKSSLSTASFLPLSSSRPSSRSTYLQFASIIPGPTPTPTPTPPSRPSSQQKSKINQQQQQQQQQVQQQSNHESAKQLFYNKPFDPLTTGEYINIQYIESSKNNNNNNVCITHAIRGRKFIAAAAYKQIKQ